MVIESQPCPACDQPVVSESLFCIECGTNILLASKVNFGNIEVEVVFNDDLVTNYIKLNHSLGEMRNVEGIAEMQESHCEMLENQKSKLTKSIQQARLGFVKEKKDVEELKSLTWKSIKARVKGDIDEMRTIEEQEHILAKKQLESLLEQQNDMNNQIKIAQKQLIEAYKLVKKKIEIQNKLKELITKIGKDLTHPEEDRLEEETTQLATRVSKLDHKLFVLKTNQSYAFSAINLFNIALAGIGEAKNAPIGIVDGNLSNNRTQRFLLDEARYMAHWGNNQLDIAITGLEGGEFNEMVHVRETSGWADILYINLWTGLFMGIYASKKIEESQDAIMKAIGNAEMVSQKYQSLIMKLDGELGILKQEFTVAEEKLEVERIKLLEKYLEKGK